MLEGCGTTSVGRHRVLHGASGLEAGRQPHLCRAPIWHPLPAALAARARYSGPCRPRGAHQRLAGTRAAAAGSCTSGEARCMPWLTVRTWSWPARVAAGGAVQQARGYHCPMLPAASGAQRVHPHSLGSGAPARSHAEGRQRRWRGQPRVRQNNNIPCESRRELTLGWYRHRSDLEEAPRRSQVGSMRLWHAQERRFRLPHVHASCLLRTPLLRAQLSPRNHASALVSVACAIRTLSARSGWIRERLTRPCGRLARSAPDVRRARHGQHAPGAGQRARGGYEAASGDGRLAGDDALG
eukprot:scaffold4822_cov378-Prasinococcus_capsulatus_cf.AAC.2